MQRLPSFLMLDQSMGRPRSRSNVLASFLAGTHGQWDWNGVDRRTQHVGELPERGRQTRKRFRKMQRLRRLSQHPNLLLRRCSKLGQGEEDEAIPRRYCRNDWPTVGFNSKEAAFKGMKEKLGVDPNSKFKRLTLTTTLLVIGRDNSGTGQEKTAKEREARKRGITCIYV